MDLNEFRHMWENEKEDWVLVNTQYGYAVVNKRTQMTLLISDDAIEEAMIKRMLKEGNQIYSNINDAYGDV